MKHEMYLVREMDKLVKAKDCTKYAIYPYGRDGIIIDEFLQNRNIEHIKVDNIKRGEGIFDLSVLMPTCKKRWNYRIAIKKLINSNLVKTKKEKTIPNHNSYCFERIADVEKQEGISSDYMKNLYIFINDKKDEQEDNKDELTENLCSTSNQKTDGWDALDETDELVEIGKSKICFNFNNLLY